MATRYPLNLPVELKQAASRLAKQPGVSLNQFFLWSIAEKVTELKSSLDDPRFAQVTYRRGSSGIPTPVLRGTGVRVETIVVAHQTWGLTPEQIADEYGLPIEAIQEALAYYAAHPEEIDALIQLEKLIEARHVEA